jgi:hypothetical protein
LFQPFSLEIILVLSCVALLHSLLVTSPVHLHYRERLQGVLGASDGLSYWTPAQIDKRASCPAWITPSKLGLFYWIAFKNSVQHHHCFLHHNF